jgi:hypothetical protein
MLRVAAPQPASLVLPGGIPYRAPRQPASDLERCAAAGAIATLASTHREFALSFRQALAQSLQVGDADRYDLQTGGGEQSPELQVGEPQGLAIRCQRHCRAAHLLGGERSRMPSMTQVWQNPAVTENCRDTVEGLNRRISVTGHGPPSGRPPHHPRDTWQDQSGLDASDSRPAQWRGCGIVLDTRPPRAHSHGIPPSSRNSP